MDNKNLTFKIIKLRDDAILPVYQTESAAGADICACIEKPIIIRSMERLMVPTGLSIEIPSGYEMQIRARSGLSIKNGIAMVNGVGTIDADYRGEVSVLMINLGIDDFTIEPGMRIAQAVVTKYEYANWQLVDSLSETERGIRGFGSTGV